MPPPRVLMTHRTSARKKDKSCLSFNGGVYELLNRVVSIIQTYCKQDNRRFDGKLRSIDNQDDE